MVGKSKTFEGEGYSLSIVSKNIAVTDAIEKYILEKVSKVERFANHIIDIVVTLDIQRVTNTVSIVMKFLHFKIKVQAQTEDMYSSIDKATERLLKLVKKYKDKLNHHRVTDSPSAPMRVSILVPVSDIDEINDQIAEENLIEDENLYRVHEVVSTETMPLRTFTQDEAAMKFDLSGDDFLIYKSQEDQNLKVMFRRKDKKLGVVQIV